ncbi:hypothetical protein LCGC14_0289390 [marine sediment metagenome]|uniref:Uncharacterized protein n=1 Tax=marine sediment metagenome TaxID=412755 RepID=A0A0F9UAT5_9ZZZZ
MCNYCGEHASGVIPTQDYNVQTPAAQATGTANPPIPADHEQQTPEFLQKLIASLNTLRQEQSELYAKMYPPMKPGQSNAPARPPYEVLEEYKRQDREYDDKINALRMQIRELHILLARKAEAMPKPELEKTPGPTAPPTSPPAEAVKGA